MKRTLCLVLALTMVFAVCFCGSASAADDKVYEIRLASTQADGNDLDLTLDLFAELCYEKSDGRLKVTVYPGTILGDEPTTTEMVQHDQIEMTMTSDDAEAIVNKALQQYKG